MFRSVLVAASLSAIAFSQSVSYTDSGITFQGLQEPTHGVNYGFVLPPAGSTGSLATEFIGEIVAPIANQWVGIALGGQMADNLLLVAWPNEDSVVFTPRYTTGYIQPTVYSGPTITTLESSVNSTAWKWIFRCQNCTVWTGGTLDTTGTPVMAWVISNEPVDIPSDPASNFNEHDDFGFWGEILTSANSDDYNSYLNIGGSSSASGTPTAAPASTAPIASSVPVGTSTASGATQTHYGQCGGNGWAGPTVCASPFTCVAVSAPYYSQCQ